MSNYEVETTAHDLHVSLAINVVTSMVGGTVTFSDGGLSYRSHLAPTPPVLYGYRPDAIVESDSYTWLVEVKSSGDFESVHSRDQYKVLSRLMLQNPTLAVFILVFDGSGKNIRVPEEFIEHEKSKRLLISYI